MTLSFDDFTLAASTADLAEEPAAREHADAVEFRMDLAANPLDALADYDGELPLIATNRVKWEGGEAADDEDRLEALSTAVDHDAVGAIDVELEALKAGDGAEVVASARSQGTKVIVSTHDFEETPGLSDLGTMVAEACRLGDVGKVATTANDRGDVLNLLRVTHEFTEAGETVATMAMGEAGRHSRAVAPIYGSKIGYAPVDPEQATAPGQYDLATLADLVAQLDETE